MTVDRDDVRADEGVVTPVPVDPAFAEAVEDALAGPQEPTSPLDPNRRLGADPHDFAGLYIRHRSAFSAHARRFLRDPRDVDEVVQEAFLRLFLVLPELQSELQALAYCRRTVTNLCIDRYRADQRRPRLVDLESVPVDVLGEDEPDDPLVQAEDAAIVREALALLSPLHREALVKREIEEKPLPVIAAELGVPEDSVKHLLHRARRALRRRLAQAHAARGLDVDDMSTLSLLARSAVSGTGRVGVFVLLFLGLVAGASTTKAPVEAFETISGLWQPDPPAAPAPTERDVAAEEGGSSAPVVRTPGVLGADRDYPGPIALPPDPVLPTALATAGPAAAVVPPASAATDTAGTSPSPSAPATAAAGPSAPGTPAVLPSAPADVDPRPEPSGEPSSPPSSPPPASAPARSAADDKAEPEAGSASPVAAPAATSAGGQPEPAEGGPVRMPAASQLRR